MSIAAALKGARDTRQVEIGGGAIGRTREVFRNQFGERDAVIVADANTIRFAPHGITSQFIFEDKGFYAEHSFVERLTDSLAKHDAIPIALGAGSINDVVKLAAHRADRPYMCVATAASMDGYTAYGASITQGGIKQTFDCPAPRAVIADIDIIRAAPPQLTASGYADLLAKITAGADWILADALGVEAIDADVWQTVQEYLREAVSDPTGVRGGERAAIQRLTEGLLKSGFAMQAMQSSRPASGAEHQFSHLWDMQHATSASHGFKVGIGTLAVARLYEEIDSRPMEMARWPTWDEVEKQIIELFDGPLRETALKETRAKFVSADEVRSQIVKLHGIWPELQRKLRAQLLPAQTLARMLRDVGAPNSPEQIGISPQCLRESHRMALYIRRRFTVLDLADRLGILP